MQAIFRTIILLNVFHVVNGEILSESACHGTQSQTCDFFTLECPKGKLIKILSALYGVKETSCKRGRNCQRKSDGCCVYRTEDCHEYFTKLHSYNLYKECSFRNKCGPLPAPTNILRSCSNNLPSSYVYIEYECILDTSVLPFCNGSSLSGSDVNLVFDNTIAEYEPRTRCDCFVFFTGETIDLFFTDIRMNKRDLSGSGTDCSSAVLSDISQKHFTLPQCLNNQSEEDNFVYNKYVLINDSFSGFELSNLYVTGADDEPTLVWLSAVASEPYVVTVTCTRTLGTTVKPTTILPATTVRPIPANGTLADGDDANNTGAVVAGVLVPLIILCVIGCVIGYIFWKRKTKGGKCRETARENSYAPDVNGHREIIYDEIGHVESVRNSPIYDPVYEPTAKGSNGTPFSHNNQTYQNNQTTHNESQIVPNKVENKHSKNPIRAISSQTSRFFAWFRAKTDSHTTVDKTDSYDHIRAGNRPVIVRVTAPEESEHVYSHQNNRPTLDNPVETSSTGGRISRDMSAIHVGDSYIEFTFDQVDKNSPNLLRKDTDAEKDNIRPVPPTRPPPSPSAPPFPSPKLATAPKLGIEPSSSRGTSPVTDRQSLDVVGITEKNIIYDYAESQLSSRRNSNASKSDISDHSYKILEKQETYDYADMDCDPNQSVDTETSGDYSGSCVYEDVDQKLRAESVKRHKSSTDIQEYEVPVTTHTRPMSSPHGQKINKPDQRDSPDSSILNKELLKKKLRPVGAKGRSTTNNQGTEHSSEKCDVETTVPYVNIPIVNLENASSVTYEKKPETTPLSKVIKESSGDISNPQNAVSKANASSVIKGDNVLIKDYEKADLVGVRNMAKLFESKA